MTMRMQFPAAFSALQWCAVLVGLSVTVSVVLDNVLLALILLGALFWVGSIARVAAAHPPARAATLLFAVLLAAAFYGATPPAEAFGIVGKYLKLLFFPIFVFLLADEIWRRRARRVFLAAMALTLALSGALGLGVLPLMPWMNTITPDNPSIFHSYITQNNMMAFAAFLALLESRDAATPALRFTWAVFALLAAANVAFMVQGRTGYLVLVALLGWFAWASLARRMRAHGKGWGWRQGLLLVAVLAAAVLSAYHFSARLHDRVALAVSEYRAWVPDHGKETSIGQRLDFYSNTLRIVRAHPLFGVGTGGFPDAFAEQARGKDVLLTRNPHNEYLMITVQTGVAGLALLLYWFYAQWRAAPSLPSPLEQDAARGLVFAGMLDCLFNSALFDHADGLFFVFMAAILSAGLKKGAPHG